ncbi:sugar transferase [Larkinella sp. VNQ87]|uniref:sugar transferase n=1 Tax=Larkinella sp. VNQ87 TaxID=3400921 RepID=UPI003C03A9E1
MTTATERIQTVPEPALLPPITGEGVFSAEEVRQMQEATEGVVSPAVLRDLFTEDELSPVAGGSNRAVVIPDLLRLPADLNAVFRSMFEQLQTGGFLVCRLETSQQRKQRLIRKLPGGIRQVYYLGDYALHRVAPRLFLTRTLYRKLFVSLRAISKAEVIGRLYYAGFSVDTVLEAPDHLVIVARKTSEQYTERRPSSEGPLLRLWRVGRGGRSFCVYKFRTMHPYSEHLQEYLIQTNGLETGGKFRNDFRITTPGKWMRKYWIDEIPMVINLLKGDMKLVGVRPLSAHYLSLYPEEVQQARFQFKPGLLPPYYADMPQNFAEIVESERRYLDAYAKAPLRTDLRYLGRIVYNILWKRARSK